MTPVFEYREDDGRFPVAVGDVWQAEDATGAAHAILACGDLQLGSWQAAHRAAGEPRISLLYADPPWGAGNAKTFRTKAGLNDGPVDFPALVQAIAVIADLAAEWVIEMGGRQAAQTSAILEDVTGRSIHAYRGGWGRKAVPGAVQRGEAEYSKMQYLTTSTRAECLDGVCDDYTPPLAIEALTQPGQWVTDCCTGRGLTPRSALKLGRRFVGSELNPRRMAITLQKLCNENNLDARKVA
jgi:hypothetical protein